ncbi:SDR family NAD(P)-dependent oxidoreductase [Solirubrobacter soli]|uniref:SDR family NAD(P)-dependent oxidoreductase n=1 Tax=Solirubrobacter soli TaxID=363832 RepID=UPI00352E5FBA
MRSAFGAVWVTQAALPVLRAQRSGHIVQVSSEGGVTAYPSIGAYHASKWALEGLTQSLMGEVEPLGIKVTLIEPGGFSTDWAGPSALALLRAAGLRRGASRVGGLVGARAGRPVRDARGDPRGRGRRRAAAPRVLRQVLAAHGHPRLPRAADDLEGVGTVVDRGVGLTPVAQRRR